MTDNRTFWRSYVAHPPLPQHVTPALMEAREAWYGSNPWLPDWEMVARCQKGAHQCLREREDG